MLTLRQFKDIPLQIQNVRNLQSANWSTDLEIEIRNVSGKPIYFVLANLDFPNHSTPSGIWFDFGNRSNIQIQRLAKADDPHIDPGQTLVLRIAEQFWGGLRIQDQNSPEMFRKLDLHLAVVSFGDRTGFEVERAADYRSNPPPVEEVVEPIEQRRPSRSLNNKIPDKVPIKVTIRPEIEKAFNDLDNQNWLREFEIEITNTSNKPIYFLEFWLTMRAPMDRQDGFWLRYGRADFISLSTTAVADDVPIKPGETKHLKIEERWIRAYEQHAVRDHVLTVNQMDLRFAQLSYGDGSGFRLMRGDAERYRPN